jgi:bacterioferritin
VSNSNETATASTARQPFLTDIVELRRRAREHMEDGAITSSYRGNAQQAIDILQSALATEIVCVLRYTMNAIAATGIASDGAKAEFAEHATEEQGHMMQIAERINQLGGLPNFNPDGLATRAAAQYAENPELLAMVRENLVAERIAIEHYGEMIAFFADKDPTTRLMLEGILAKEEEHASDMLDLLVAHASRVGKDPGKV